jgi:hypothetical protein
MSAPVFQHRHYVWIAETIVSIRGKFGSGDARIIAEHFADDLGGTNPNFDRQRFVDAATGEPSNGRDRTIRCV